MSVIGKMTVASAEEFANGQKVKLTCVCENELMAHYHPENENVVFTRYSPSGEANLQFDKPVDLPKVPASYKHYETGEDVHFEKACELYLVYLKQPEQPNVVGAAFFGKLRVHGITDYGTTKSIELCNPYSYHGTDYPFAPGEARGINIKLGIDNPGASDQFQPATDGWWVVAYRADQMTQAEALALAHA
jgi:hypothetical protein